MALHMTGHASTVRLSVFVGATTSNFEHSDLVKPGEARIGCRVHGCALGSSARGAVAHERVNHRGNAVGFVNRHVVAGAREHLQRGVR